MWKLVLIVALCVASGLAAKSRRTERAEKVENVKKVEVQDRQAKKYVVQILKQENILEPNGDFRNSYEAEDGSKAGEVGQIKIIDDKTAEKSVSGFWEYQVGGKTIRSEYVADKNGFNVRGDHIPAVPSYILKSLEYIRTHPPKDEEDRLN